jgi:hypothetical protein
MRGVGFEPTNPKGMGFLHPWLKSHVFNTLRVFLTRLNNPRNFTSAST